MAIRMMTSKENKDLPNVKEVTDFSGHETWRISHHYNCQEKNNPDFINKLSPVCKPHKQNECFGCRPYEPIYIMTEYVGCVLEIYERNGYDDSDFYAVVWDEKSQELKHIEYRTTRGWTYPNSADVDATAEVKEKANKWRANKDLELIKKFNHKESKMPYVGRKIKVVGGRKVAHGTIATVFWFGDDKYKQRNARDDDVWNTNKYLLDFKRVGIQWMEDGNLRKEYVSGANVEVIEPEQYLFPLPEEMPTYYA